MPKRVTPAKLIAASRALIALSECEDWPELSWAKQEAWDNADAPAFYDVQLPNQLQLAILANEMSGMLEAFA